MLDQILKTMNHGNSDDTVMFGKMRPFGCHSRHDTQTVTLLASPSLLLQQRNDICPGTLQSFRRAHDGVRSVAHLDASRGEPEHRTTRTNNPHAMQWAPKAVCPASTAAIDRPHACVTLRFIASNRLDPANRRFSPYSQKGGNRTQTAGRKEFSIIRVA